MNFNLLFKELAIKYINFFYIIHNLYIRNKIFINREYYSQFGEDKFILDKFKKNGFYVDVGCHHPIRMNNCHLLYKNNWRGINIDLSKISIDLFNFTRKDDVNVNIAVSLKKGRVKYYYDKPLSLYNSLLKTAQLKYSKIINSDRLDNIIEKTRFRDKEIDFLSIDVEGKDFDVLKSLNFKRYKPKSICVEIWEKNKKYKKSSIGFNKNSLCNFLVKKGYYLAFNKGENYIFLKKIIFSKITDV